MYVQTVMAAYNAFVVCAAACKLAEQINSAGTLGSSSCRIRRKSNFSELGFHPHSAKDRNHITVTCKTFPVDAVSNVSTFVYRNTILCSCNWFLVS